MLQMPTFSESSISISKGERLGQHWAVAVELGGIDLDRSDGLGRAVADRGEEQLRRPVWQATPVWSTSGSRRSLSQSAGTRPGLGSGRRSRPCAETLAGRPVDPPPSTESRRLRRSSSRRASALRHAVMLLRDRWNEPVAIEVNVSTNSFADLGAVIPPRSRPVDWHWASCCGGAKPFEIGDRGRRDPRDRHGGAKSARRSSRMFAVRAFPTFNRGDDQALIAAPGIAHAERLHAVPAWR